MVKTPSLFDTVKNLLSIAESGQFSNADLDEIVSLLPLHSGNHVVGKMFGYSVSDYAFATLKWLNSSKANDIFADEFSRLGQFRKEDILALIEKKYYLSV
jgi:hypothetical protein